LTQLIRLACGAQRFAIGIGSGIDGVSDSLACLIRDPSRASRGLGGSRSYFVNTVRHRVRDIFSRFFTRLGRKKNTEGCPDAKTDAQR
jgi:hypothetical protein